MESKTLKYGKILFIDQESPQSNDKFRFSCTLELIEIYAQQAVVRVTTTNDVLNLDFKYSVSIKFGSIDIVISIVDRALAVEIEGCATCLMLDSQTNGREAASPPLVNKLRPAYAPVGNQNVLSRMF